MKVSHPVPILALVALCVAALGSLPAAAQDDSGALLPRRWSTPDERPAPDLRSEHPGQIKRTPALPDLANLPDLRTQEGKEELIRRSYAAVRLYSLASGAHPSFELSEFRTLERVDFGRVRWFDLVTPPGGQVVQMTIHTDRASDGRPLLRTYTPHWLEAPQDYAQTTEGKRFADARVDEALAAAAGDMPELLGVTAVTAYRVTVTLDGESRSYQAAYLWKETGGGLTYQAYDPVTTGVDRALAEKVPTGRFPARSDALLDELKNTSGAVGFDETCVANETFSNYNLQAADFQGHQSGDHEVDGFLNADCRCNADCSQDCSANVGGSCAEYGTTDTCHKISAASEDSMDGNAFYAISAGSTASCGGGVGCAWQACTLCLCSPRISVSYGGAGLSVGSFSGTATVKKGRQHTCAPCEIVPEDDPTDPPPPTGGGGGGGEPPGGGCFCDCDGDGWVTVEECELDCGGIADVEEGVCWVN